MITYEFFVKNLGFSEQKAKQTIELLKNSPTGSIRGILRQHESTLLQKFNFYQNELCYSINEIFEDPRILSYDTSSEPDENEESDKTESKKESNVKAKLRFLRGPLGLSNEEIRKYTLLSYPPNTLKAKIADMKKHLGFDISHIKSDLSLFNYDTDTLIQKAEFYKKHLGFTTKQFKDFPRLFTFDCSEESDNPTAIINKIKFYENTLGYSSRHFKILPCLLSFDTVSDETEPTSVRAKIKFYHDELDFEPKHFQKSPSLLCHDCISDESVPTSVRAKLKFFRERFDFENKQFQDDPGIFSYDCTDSGSPTSVWSKFKFYNRELGLQPKHIKENTILLHFDCESEPGDPDSNGTSIKEKIAKLREIGVTNEEIQANSKILCSPAADIKDKFALWSIIFPNRCFTDVKTWFITRPEKIYARQQYLVNDYKIQNLRPGHLDISEKEFQKRYKASSEELMLIYPMNQNIIENFYVTYNNMGLQPPLQRG